MFAPITGVKTNVQFVGDDAGWTEFVYRKTHNDAIKSFLQAHRPISEYWFDWDITAMVGEAI